MAGRVLTRAEVLARIPQREPFRFVDEILEVDDDHIVATYRLRADADFYRGHFPGDPVTPGVLLVEAMAQASVVALGAYLLAKELARGGGREDRPVLHRRERRVHRHRAARRARADARRARCSGAGASCASRAR